MHQQNNNPNVDLQPIIPIQNAETRVKFTRESIKDNPKILRYIIRKFLNSPEYKEMELVDQYYDYKNKAITDRQKMMMLLQEKEEIKDGKAIKNSTPYLAPDLSKANYKVAHGYLFENINHAKSYLVGNPVRLSYKEDKPLANDKDAQNILDDILYKYNKWGLFNQTNVVNTQKYIKGWVRVAVDPDNGQLKLIPVNSKEVIPFFDDFEKLTCLIHIYNRLEVEAQPNGAIKEVLYKYAEVFDESYKDVYRSKHNRDYEIFEEDVPLLQKITVFGEDEVNEEGEVVKAPSKTSNLTWDRIPWVYWKFNSDEQDALKPIQCFIDLLDMDLSDLANNIDDVQDVIWILENYAGQSVSQFMEDLKIKKAINVGEDGDARPQTTEIPYEARMKLYEACEKAIYKFGRDINFADRDNLGNASGVALKWSFGPLDQKCDDLEENGKSMIDDLLNLIFTYLNATGQSKYEYDSNDIEIIFDRSMIINEKEQVDMVMASADIISRKTNLEHHPFVADAEEEMKRIDSDPMNVEEADTNDQFDDSEEDESESEQEEYQVRRDDKARDKEKM